MGICSRYCSSRDHAQDVLQEAFISIFTGIDKYKGTGSFEGWMTRIVINTAITMNKKWDYRKVTGELEDLELAAPDLHPVEKLSHQELLQLVQQLPVGYRTVFNLFVIDGYSHDEIAETLKISTGTSKSQLSRAKDQLAKWIKLIEKPANPNTMSHEKK